MKHITNKIPAWLAGELSDEETQQVKDHCLDCPTCAAAVQSESDLWALVDTVADLPLPPTSVWPRVQARTFYRPVAGGWFFGNRVWVRTVLASLALTAGLLAGLWLPGTGTSDKARSLDVAQVDIEDIWLGDSSGSWSETAQGLDSIWLTAGQSVEGDES